MRTERRRKAREGAALTMQTTLSDAEPAPDRATDTLLVQMADGKTRQVTLSLHRSGSDWRLVMPGAAIDKIATELAGTPSPVAHDAEPPHI